MAKKDHRARRTKSSLGVWIRIGLTATALFWPLPIEEGWSMETISRPSRGWEFKVHGGRLSALIDQVPLRKVLRELSRHVPVEVSIVGSVARDPVSVRFRDLSFEEGMRKILEGKEYAIFHAAHESSSETGTTKTVRQILVFSRPGSEDNTRQEWGGVSGDLVSVVAQMKKQALEARKPADRLYALEELRDLADEEELMPILMRTLEDRDSKIRELTLEVLEDSFGEVPHAQLEHMALRDKNPKLRARALTLLAFRGDADVVAPLTQALDDPDPHVRETASELLQGLTTRATSPATPLQN